VNIAVLLHSGAGGSGVVATETGLAFAQQGYNVHFVADRVPFRLTEMSHPNVFFHRVSSFIYPLFDAPLTTLSEASKLAEVIEECNIDVIHAHYAIPHATAAILARDMVQCPLRPVVVTTLHGTDVTLVGLDRAYLRTTQYAIEHSDAVTAVSRFLADYTVQEMDVRRDDIMVVPNMVDAERFQPQGDSQLRQRYAQPDEKLLVHVSNFRAVKRPLDVIKTFAQVNQSLAARLLMIGDGPERQDAMQLASELGVSGRVSFLGSFPRIEEILSVCDLFLLPSSKESFGLAALEAMSSGVPVIASNTGGLPEVVIDGETGYLCAVGDTETMGRKAVQLLRDPELHQRMKQQARARAMTCFNQQQVIPLYQQAYEKALEKRCVAL
jgi:N-acetyl-alpha-D-glucosaminyl L-malate synthase BshA